VHSLDTLDIVSIELDMRKTERLGPEGASMPVWSWVKTKKNDRFAPSRVKMVDVFFAEIK
jgi:hypothetical protein